MSIILTALGDPELRGVVNAVTPHPVTNAEFTKRYAAALHRPAWLPAPAFMLKLAFGSEQVHEMLLWGQRVRPGVLETRGFEYEWPTLDEALRAIIDDDIELSLAQAATLEVVG